MNASKITVRKILTGLSVCFSTFLLCSPGHAQTVEEFYRGKTVSLIVSSDVGGGYDGLARITVRTLAKHLPGNPTLVVRNMPGAGGIRAPNFVYTVAERDGTVLALMQNTIPFEPLAGNKAAVFDPLKLMWLGSPNVESGVLMVWHTAGVRTIEDLQTKEITIGVPAAASTPAYNSRLLIQVLGAKLKIVPGYPGSNAALLAMERGEVDSYPHFYASMMQARPTWLKEKKINVVAQWGPYKEKEIPDVPFLPEIIKDPDKLALLKASSASFALGRPFMMPPGVPQARFEAMRKAMFATFNDPAFSDDAQKIAFGEITPQTGEQIEKVIREVYASPPHIVEQFKLIATGEIK